MVEKRLYGLDGTYAAYLVDAKSAKALAAWAKSHNIEIVDDLHVTTVYSRVPLPAYKPAEYATSAMPTGIMVMDDDSLALTFEGKTIGEGDNAMWVGGSYEFCWRHEDAARLGATWDYPEYIPHLTVAKDWPKGEALPPPPPFAISFDKEVAKPLKEPGSADTVDEENVKMKDVPERFSAAVKFAKIEEVSEDQRLVGGWFSVVHDGENPVVDHQGDLIELDDLRKAVHEFVKVRVGKSMHEGEQVADLVEVVIVDDTLRKALGAPKGPTGAWAVWKVNDDETWKKIKNGDLAAFSIGGSGVRIPID